MSTGCWSLDSIEMLWGPTKVKQLLFPSLDSKGPLPKSHLWAQPCSCVPGRLHLPVSPVSEGRHYLIHHRHISCLLFPNSPAHQIQELGLLWAPQSLWHRVSRSCSASSWCSGWNPQQHPTESLPPTRTAQFSRLKGTCPTSPRSMSANRSGILLPEP